MRRMKTLRKDNNASWAILARLVEFWTGGGDRDSVRQTAQVG